MNDSDDVKRIDELIRKHKIEAKDPDELEYAEFIDYTDSNDNDADDTTEIDDYEIPEFPKSDITQFHTFTPVHFLTDEEKSVVESCPDPDLKQLLLLNRNKNIQLMQLYKKIKDLLGECQQNITMKEEFISAARTRKRVCNKIWRLGIPYFKSKDNFPCPRNEDIIRKHNNGELLFYDMTASSKWTERDMNRLLKGIAFHYKVFRENELEKKIKAIEKKSAEKGIREEREEFIQELKNELEDVKSCQRDMYPPLGSDNFLDWNRISECFLKDKYSAQDCQTFWNIYLHPEINKESWTREENDKLKILAMQYKLHNWDLIAAELGNNRTGFIACVHYFCKIDPVRQGRFTEAEDKLLCDLVTQYKQGEYIPWTKIAHHFKDRTRGQLFYRYKYFLSCQGKKKGKFTKAEDILILVLVDRFGKKFTKCGEYFPDRSVVQIKARYSSNLRGALKKGSFTVEEDEAILKYVQMKDTFSWEPLVRQLHRCGGQIRQRYNTLNAFAKANPGVDLANAPRRRFGGISFDTEYDFLRCTADIFKNCEKIPTLQDIEKLLMNPAPRADPLEPLTKELGARKEVEDTETTRESVETTVKSKNEDFRTKKKTPERKGKKKTLRKVPQSVADRSKTKSSEDASDTDETFPELDLSVDNLLVDFFSNSLRLNFEQSVSQQRIEKAAATVASVLSTLQVELSVPTDFESNPRLDSIDMDILKTLTVHRPINASNEYVINRQGLEIDRLIPPNLNTVVGIRSLLIKNQIYKSRNSRRAYIFENFKIECKEKQVLWCINNHLSNQSQDTQNVLVSERNVFFKRFISLFKFPAIMTLQKPSELLESGSKAWRTDNKTIRTYTMKKSRPIVAVENRTSAEFETVFIKQQPEDDDYDSTLGPSRSSNSSDASGTGSRILQSEPKLSIVEQLKRKINDTIDELCSASPKKKYYGPPISRFPPTPISSQPCNQEESIRPTKTYIPKYKVKPRVVTAKAANFRRQNAETVKIEALQDLNLDDAEAQSSFNLSKGELVLENDSPCSSANGTDAVNQDLLDLNVLEAMLKKEKNVVEESFDF